MLVVVVLPCVPATPMPCCPSIKGPRKSLRLTTGMPAAWAAATSGFSAGTADEISTRSAPRTYSARWPRKIVAPRLASSWVASFSNWSEPETVNPSSRSRPAMADNPDPPIPTR